VPVAIHRIVAAANRRNPQSGEPARIAREFLEIGKGGLRRGVAAVEKGVDRHRHPRLGEDMAECGDLVLMRVHAARRHQAQQVGGAARPFQSADKIAQCRHPREFARSDRRIDARQVLHDQPAGADIGVADLGIAHLPIGQPDKVLARLQMRMRPARQ
jgi:hypothetical protein